MLPGVKGAARVAVAMSDTQQSAARSTRDRTAFIGISPEPPPYAHCLRRSRAGNAQKKGAGRTCPTRRTLEYRRVNVFRWRDEAAWDTARTERYLFRGTRHSNEQGRCQFIDIDGNQGFSLIWADPAQHRPCHTSQADDIPTHWRT